MLQKDKTTRISCNISYLINKKITYEIKFDDIKTNFSKTEKEIKYALTLSINRNNTIHKSFLK